MTARVWRDVLRPVVGPAVRVVRREHQWRTCGDRLDLRRGPAEVTPYLVATHRTPLFRRLSGLDHQLQVNKVANLRLAAACLDGLVLEPGERLSFWYHVRKPTARRGFLPGLVLDQGRMVSDVGGGLCQLTNLLYWMTLHTPLEIAERWRHTYDVFPDAGRTQPFASGATCAWPCLDLQIRNPTASTYRLSVTVGDTDLVGRWDADLPCGLAYEVYEAAHRICNDLPGVFVRRNLLRRRVYDVGGALLDDEPVCLNEALMMYAPFLAGASQGASGGADG